MRTSDAGIDLIEQFESLQLHAYRDPVGIVTIGYGHTGPDVHMGQTITAARARQLLQEDLVDSEALVRQLVHRPLNQSQFDALVSIVFNTGPSPLQKTLGRCVNAGDFTGASREFGKWCKGTDHGRLVTLAGLVRRRAAEVALFNAGPQHSVTPWLTTSERNWVTRFDELDDAGRRNSREAHALQDKMRRQRKVIWRLAQPKAKGGDGKGWHFRHRAARYRAVKARSS
jgi:lysozyme